MICQKQYLPLQEISDGNNVYCGNVLLGTPPDAIVTRIANEVYSAARSGKLTITGFPDFSPTIHALAANAKAANSRVDYKVTVNKGGKLMILEAFAAKFVEGEQTKERAEALIESHNQRYNKGGDYWFRRVFIIFHLGSFCFNFPLQLEGIVQDLEPQDRLLSAIVWQTSFETHPKFTQQHLSRH